MAAAPRRERGRVNRMDFWRDFDLTKRKEKITRAVNLQPLRSPEDFPIVVNTPCYFGFADKNRHPDYYRDPAVMVKYQEDGFQRHLSLVHDDTVPYFMPWFGTGVLATAFGCPCREAAGVGDDPALTGHCIEEPEDIAHLKLPDPYQDGWMPRVLNAIDYARAHSDLPIGLTDMNSPLCTAAQMCGYENLFIWMYEEPEAVQELMSIVTEAIINWIKVQKEHNGEPLDSSNGLQGIWAPKGLGVWLSDDDIVSMSPELYEEFVVPHYSRIFETFGGGSLHFCGSATKQLDSALKIKNLKVVNNSNLMDYEAFGELVRRCEGKYAVQIQDATYFENREYFTRLFEKMETLEGKMIAAFAPDYVMLAARGSYVDVEKDGAAIANQVVDTVREFCARKMGE